MTYTLRVSVLEQCQLRCRYCLPKDFSFSSKSNWLKPEQYRKIARAMRPLLIDKLRFTGGEPLLRQDLSEIIRSFTEELSPRVVAITTNGHHFIEKCSSLLDAGLNAITFHLDTLRQSRYANVMGRGEVGGVFSAIDHALRRDLSVKINVVMQRGVNDDEIIDFLKLSRKLGVVVRFIELMNTGSARSYVQERFMSGDDIRASISHYFSLKPLGRSPLSSPAEMYLIDDLDIRFGIIASETEPFCKNCNRLRLSADGRLRTCLYEPSGQKLPQDDEALVRDIQSVVATKTSFHPLSKKNINSFSMSQIGG